MMIRSIKYIFLGLGIFLTPLFVSTPSLPREQEKDYTISLVKTAHVKKEDIYEVDEKKVMAQEYTIQKRDYLWKIFRKKGLLRRNDTSELLSVLKKLNKSLRNLDLVHPGQKVLIPLKIVPIKGQRDNKGPFSEKVKTITPSSEINFERYTVRRGDSLIRIIKGRYNVPAGELNNKYLPIFRRMNPSIKDPDTIYPGQVVKLPIYSPEIVRGAIEMPTSKGLEDKGEGEREEVKEEVSPVANGLSEIFSEMGEEWIQSGEHFIPLKSGGQIDLMAKSFPLINLQNGKKIIVDLDNKLPDNMARLIMSSWVNYRVVHFEKGESLRSSLDKTLNMCGYPRIFKRGEPLELQGPITFRITADRIVELSDTRSDNRRDIVVINIKEANTPKTPQEIKDYLEGMGVNVIDYPPGNHGAFNGPGNSQVKTLRWGGDSRSLIETILDLSGRPFSTQVEIPVYQSRITDFKWIINADFFLNIKGRDAIIDITSLAPEIISFLKEHGFLVLSLAGERDPLDMVTKTLKFLDVQFDSSPHSFMTRSGDSPRNISLTLPGLVFAKPQGKGVLVTPQQIPEEIERFLSRMGYEILLLSSPDDLQNGS